MKKKISLVLAGILLLPTSIVTAAQMNNSSNSQESQPPKVSQDTSIAVSKLEFSSLSFPKSVDKNSPVQVKFSLKNTGDGGAKNISINAMSQDKQGLVGDSNKININNLAPGQEKSHQFEFEVSDNAKPKNCPIKLVVNYTDEKTNKPHTISQTIIILIVDGKGGISSENLPNLNGGIGGGASNVGSMEIPSLPSGGASISGGGAPLPVMDSSALSGMGGETGSGNSNVANMPKIIIEEYSLSPETIQTGSPFTLNLRIYNTNGKKSVQNIRVSLSGEAASPATIPPSGDSPLEAAMAAEPAGGSSSAFIPIGSSNTFYIEKINPKKTYSKDLMLTTVPDTAAKTYSLAVNFEYEDANGNTYQSSEIIGIPVVQKSELTLGDVNVEKTGFVGEQLPLSLEFFNTGKSNIENVMVKVRGNFETDLNTYYAGTMTPGATDSYSVNLTPEKSGKQTGDIVITYDDSAGNSQEVIQPFVIEVEDEAPSDDGENNGSQRPAWVTPAAIAGILLITGGIGFFVYKKRKNNDDDDKDLKI